MNYWRIALLEKTMNNNTLTQNYSQNYIKVDKQNLLFIYR